ncbi:retrovirus-related pol polyprotein from transposon TNT 1-94 [Tanacetum coccineum]
MLTTKKLNLVTSNPLVRRFIKKTGRNLDFKEKQPVTFDKSQVECYNCHKKRHFAKECNLGWNQGKRSYDDNGRRNATSNKPSSQALVAQDGLGGYDWSNDFDKPVNYALMAISSSSSSSSSDNENELAWGEKYDFQNYKLKYREIKNNNLQMELEKVVKERDELKVKIEKWEESSKGLNKLLNSQMSAKDKNGLGYGTQLDEMSNKSETDSEISLSVFEVRLSDKEITPANDKFSKAVGYHAVPLLITGNFLTPRADISFAGLDEYAIRKKIIEDKVIIEDWDSDDVSEINTVNPVKTNETQTVKTQVDKIGQISQKEGIGFKKIKACFVCKSTDHLIKDCDFYAKKSPEPKLKTVVNTGQRVVKPVWDNAKRVNRLVNPVRTNGKRAVHTVSTARPISTARPGNLKISFEDQCSGDKRSDHGTEFKNHAMNESCAKKRIKREFSVARTPQQNGVAERKNRTLIEAARTMLADSLLPIPFWAEAVNTACYVLNRVLVTKPQNKTPYELLIDEGYLLGYSTTSKAFRVYNKRTKRVKENMHIDFLKDQPNMAGSGPDCMFDLDFLTNTINYIPVSVENQVNVDAGTQEHYVAGSSEKDKEPTQEYILLPLHPHRPRISVEDVVQAAQEKPYETSPKDTAIQDSEDVAEKEEQHMPSVGASNSPLVSTANTPYASAASTPTDANTGGSSFVYLGGQIPIDASTLPNVDLPIDPNMPDLEDDSNVFPNDGIFSGAYDDEDVAFDLLRDALSAIFGLSELKIKFFGGQHWNDQSIVALAQGRQISRLRATYDAELVSAASLVNTAKPTLSIARLG